MGEYSALEAKLKEKGVTNFAKSWERSLVSSMKVTGALGKSSFDEVVGERVCGVGSTETGKREMQLWYICMLMRKISQKKDILK